MDQEKLNQDLFDHANSIRKSKGLDPFVYDSRLETSAQIHATALSNGSASPHQGYPTRLYQAGFPQETDCYITRFQCNVTEGIVQTPLDLAADTVEVLLSSGPGEAHYDDFCDPKINRVGIGTGNRTSSRYWNVVELDYGRICGEEPTPTPVPKPVPVVDHTGWAGFSGSNPQAIVSAAQWSGL